MRTLLVADRGMAISSKSIVADEGRSSSWSSGDSQLQLDRRRSCATRCSCRSREASVAGCWESLSTARLIAFLALAQRFWAIEPVHRKTHKQPVGQTLRPQTYRRKSPVQARGPALPCMCTRPHLAGFPQSSELFIVSPLAAIVCKSLWHAQMGWETMAVSARGEQRDRSGDAVHSMICYTALAH